MTTVGDREWTCEDCLALPEGGGPLPYEVIDGELCMAPAPYDVVLSREPLQYARPGLVFVSNKHSAIVTEQTIQGVPDLIVETLFEGTASRDRRKKFSLYERSGGSGILDRRSRIGNSPGFPVVQWEIPISRRNRKGGYALLPSPARTVDFREQIFPFLKSSSPLFPSARFANLLKNCHGSP